MELANLRPLMSRIANTERHREAMPSLHCSNVVPRLITPVQLQGGKSGGPRLPKMPQLQDFQFYDTTRLTQGAVNAHSFMLAPTGLPPALVHAPKGEAPEPRAPVSGALASSS
eukprot:scaffold189839_cov23-Tisochrysis_lutea.AAC.1